MRTLPAEVVDLAHGQRGALTTAQARVLGLLPSDLVELAGHRQLEHPSGASTRCRLHPARTPRAGT
ncbi:hypothetical protein [Janibacter melonis]|uniref:hypothetical protein n=1 Tax=Janibacter melonis TaxID=262209 RepID=UPI002094A0C1|nr:hypothetical protein [Janibacter melonis]